MDWLLVLSVVLAYFIGNISSGIIVGKLYGLRDIREKGSGNAGTTNVMRTLGWVPSVLTLAGDVLKAFLAVWLGRLISGETAGYCCGVAVMCGHVWPVLFQFRGGKGMACALGVIFAYDAWLALALLGIQVVLVAITRYMSVASLVTSLIYPFLVAIFHPGNTPYLICSICMSALTIFCHRSNIDRLIHHTENKLDFQKISRLGQKIRDRHEQKKGK